MGQCISRHDNVGVTGDNIRSNSRIGIKGAKTSISRRKSKLTQSSFTVNSGNGIKVELSKSTDSSDSGRQVSKTKVVIIPEATDTTQISSTHGEAVVREMKSTPVMDFYLGSPTYTESTACLTPAISVFSDSSFNIDPESARNTTPASQLTADHFEKLTVSTPSVIDCSPSVDQSCTSSYNGDSSRSARKNSTIPNEDSEDEFNPKIVLGRKSKIKSYIMKDYQYPTSTELDGTVSASFTPIKQTSLQSKVSVIQEEDVLEAPSDEEALCDQVLTRRMQRELNAKTRVSGPLTPVKLRTQWKTTPSSIQLREPAIWLKSTAATSSPLRNGVEPLVTPDSNTKQLNKSVDESVLNHFQKLKLQVAVAAQEGKRNQKVAKLEDRIKDVEGYRELWGEFQQIKQQVSEAKCIRPDAAQNLTDSVQSEVEYDFEEENVTCGTSRKKRASTKIKRTLDKNKSPSHELQKTLISHSTSFAAEDKKTWIFDFETEGFDTGRKCEDDESSQASLSLLSEKSMEAQRRLFSQKRKDRKRKKKLEKDGVFGNAQTPTIHNSLARRVTVDSASVASSHGDYGPSHRLRRSTRSVDRYTTEFMQENSTVITDMEVSFGLARVNINRSAVAENDNCSMVSDLADDQSLSGSIASAYSRENGSVCSASNDYRVNKRRQRNNTHRPVDLNKFVPSSDRSVGSNSISSVVERRQAVEARLKLLCSKQHESKLNGSSLEDHSISLTSGLTKRFDDAMVLEQASGHNEFLPPDTLNDKQADRPKENTNTSKITSPSLTSSMVITVKDLPVDPPSSETGPERVTDPSNTCKKADAAITLNDQYKLAESCDTKNIDNIVSTAPDNFDCCSNRVINSNPLEVPHLPQKETAPLSECENNEFDPPKRYPYELSVASHDLHYTVVGTIDPPEESVSQKNIIEVANDENDSSKESVSEDVATISLLLADEVSNQLKDVLCRFRSPKSVHCDPCTTRPVHEELHLSDEQPPARLYHKK